MARLSIEQIRAPDLSVASQATARAGEAFSRGMSQASDLLSQYQEGLETAGDAELTNLLAGAKNEDEWNSILESTDFSKMNISAGMRENIMNRRDNILGYEQDRATRRGTDASTGLTIAQTGTANANTRRINTNTDQTIKDNNWNNGKRQESADLAGLALGADEEARRYGHQGGASEILESNVSVSTNVNGVGTGLSASRGGPAGQGDVGSLGGNMSTAFQAKMGLDVGTSDVLTEAFLMNFQDESGMVGDRVEAEDNVHGTRGKGYYQLTGSRRDNFEAKYGANGYTDANQIEFLIDEMGGPESAAGKQIIAAAQTGNVGETAALIVQKFLRPAQEHQDSRSAKYRGQTQPNARDRVTENPNQGGQAAQAYRTALANSKFQSTADVLAASQRVYEQGNVGEAAISAADAELAEEAKAQALLDAAEGNIDPTEAFLEFEKNNPGATAKERLEMRAAALEQTGEGGLLDAAQLQIGLTGISPDDTEITNSTLANIQEEQNRDPFQFAQIAAQDFKEDPAGSLRVALEGLDISAKPADIEAEINKLARDLKISREEAAYSFARGAEESWRLGRAISIGGDNLAQNNAKDFARKHFVGDRAEVARTTRADVKRVVGEIKKTAGDLGKVEMQIQKLQRNGKPVPSNLVKEKARLKSDLESQNAKYRSQNRDGDPGTGVATPVPDDRIIMPRRNNGDLRDPANRQY